MLLDPQFLAEQILNSLQFSMLLFLLAIGLSVVFGLMDYLNLSHGTIYMFAAYVAFSITHIGRIVLGRACCWRLWSPPRSACCCISSCSSAPKKAGT